MANFRYRAATPNGDAGTTLIEALVVVAITGLVALLGFPRIQQGLAAMAKHQTAVVVAARLRQVRSDALRSDQPVAFAVSPDGTRYGSGGSTTASTPPGVTLSSATGSGIAFFGDGSSSGGVILVKAAGRPVAVVVSADTGAVAVAGG
jgi:general secretion pathway protein H